MCMKLWRVLQKPGPGEHPLQYNYSMWFSRRSPKNTTYDQSLKFISSFASVSDSATLRTTSHSRIL